MAPPHTPRKALKLATEIDVHAVSCPGVWLPGRGRVALSVCLLGFHTRTNRLSPVFPVLFHEKFRFERTFVGVTNLTMLERVLQSETVYMELIQEEPAGETVLAVFETSVRDLLFPRPSERLSYSGVDMDLLMEPTRDFPGIISPKIEVSTRTSVSETRTPLHQCAQDTVSFGHSGKATKAVYRPKTPVSPLGDCEEPTVKSPGVENCSNPVRANGFENDDDIYEKGGAPTSVVRRKSNEECSPPSSPGNKRYLGIKSRYLTGGAGNIADVPRTALKSRYGTSRPTTAKKDVSFRRTSSLNDEETRLRRGRRTKDDILTDAKVTVLEPEVCPHCETSHGPESCSTCRTYHRYFPRPARMCPHSHLHSYHTHMPDTALKVLRQPAHNNQRSRKRYLAEIGVDDDGEDGLPPRRSRSLSPIRMPLSAASRDFGRGISGDEEEEEEGLESRSPSPPASHASAPATVNRKEPFRRAISPPPRSALLDSDDECMPDLHCSRRKCMHYPHCYPYSCSYYCYGLDSSCPVCNPEHKYYCTVPGCWRRHHHNVDLHSCKLLRRKCPRYPKYCPKYPEYCSICARYGL